MNIGLVLEGGAMRGMYTAGVLDTFLDNNIEVDRIVGVSAGALFGVNFLSRQRGRVIRYNKRFNSDKNYIGIRPLLREGNIVSTRYAYEKVPKYLDPFDNQTYMNAHVPFYAVMTGVNDGRPRYVQIRDVFKQMDVLRASGSMPFVSKPVKIDGTAYLDGGISDSIPYEWLLAHGCDKVIVVLTRDMSYRKKPMSKGLIEFFYHKHPRLAAQLIERHHVYNDAVERLGELEAEGKAFVIRPSDPIEIGRIESDPEKLQRVYELGIHDANDRMNALRMFSDY